MYERLGPLGVGGIVVALAGLGLVAWQAPVVAAGLALVLAGAGLAAAGVVKNALRAFGFA